MEFQEIKFLFIGIIVFSIFLLGGFRNFLGDNGAKRRVLIKVPFLGGLLGLSIYKYFGEQIVLWFYLVSIIVQLVFVSTRVRWRHFAK